jgi:hypothetical protein
MVAQDPKDRYAPSALTRHRDLSNSSNLETWIVLQTNTLVGAIWNFIDPDATNLARRFYRVKLAP